MSPKPPPPPESVQSGVGSATSEWVLVGTIGTSGLGTPERVAQLEKMKQRKTDHGETVVTCLPADTISVGCPKRLPFPSFPPSPPLIAILAVTNTILSNHAMSVLAEIISCQVSMDMEI